MNGTEIRAEGITAPGMSYGSNARDGVDTSVADNLALVVGALQEIAAQLAGSTCPLGAYRKCGRRNRTPVTVNANTRQIAELLQQRPPLKHTEIAKMVGVDRRRVYQVRKYLNENGVYQEFDPGRLIRFRSQRAWSLRELARRAKVNVSQISRWEVGKSVPHRPQWIKLAMALGVKVSDLRKKDTA